jgi:hypothetical protein
MASRIHQNRNMKPENIIIFLPMNSFLDWLSQIAFHVDYVDICEINTRNYSEARSASVATA